MRTGIGRRLPWRAPYVIFMIDVLVCANWCGFGDLDLWDCPDGPSVRGPIDGEPPGGSVRRVPLPPSAVAGGVAGEWLRSTCGPRPVVGRPAANCAGAWSGGCGGTALANSTAWLNTRESPEPRGSGQDGLTGAEDATSAEPPCRRWFARRLANGRVKQNRRASSMSPIVSVPGRAARDHLPTRYVIGYSCATTQPALHNRPFITRTNGKCLCAIRAFMVLVVYAGYPRHLTHGRVSAALQTGPGDSASSGRVTTVPLTDPVKHNSVQGIPYVYPSNRCS